MAARPRPEYLPFLAERAVEWVEPVREQALDGLRGMLARDKWDYRLRLSRAMDRLARRRHADGLRELLRP